MLKLDMSLINQSNMSIIINNHQKLDNDNENSQVISTKLEHNEGEISSTPKLRSILRTKVARKRSTNSCNNIQETSIEILKNEKDSDYTGDEEDADADEEEEESDASHISVEKKNHTNEQSHRHSTRQKQKDQFLQTSSDNILDSQKTRTEKSDSISSNRTGCVTFTSDKPTIIQGGSLTPTSEDPHMEQRSSITFINMKNNSSIPKTALTSDYRPVYVPPLKYRPLLGLSANDSRLLLEKRVSLLGKPLVFHPIQKRSISYRRTQLRIYNFLERADGYKAITYHTFVFLTVFLCLFLSVVVTMPEYERIATIVLLPSEILVFIWLSIELTLRVWSAGCHSRYQAFIGRLKFLKKPFCALDLFVIIATILTLCLNIRNGNGVFAASALRGLRFFQILRMLRMDRRGGTWKLLGSVVYAHRQELITTIYIGFLVLIFSSFIMFLVEKDIIIEKNSTNLTNLMTTGSITNLIDTDRHKFETFADALWWGIITLCTVGYGDKVPSSYIGKLIAAICSFIGISFFALPAGILGSGFALKVQQQQRQKHYKRRKIPAVLLIQNLWRVYAADEKSLSKATWKVHVRPPRKPSLTSQINNHPLSFKMRNNQSFLNRVSFRRRTTARNNQTTLPNNINMKSTSTTTINALRSCIDTVSETASITPPASIILPHEGSSSDNDDDHLFYANDVHALTTTHRHAIRFIRKIKYFVARRKFREALRPYDVTDVIEQYSTGNVDMLARMKYLQARLDKVLGSSKTTDNYESGPSLASRICKIERQVDGLNLKVDQLCQLATRLLEHEIRHQTPISNPSLISPIVMNRVRTGNHFRIHRRRRRRSPTLRHNHSELNPIGQPSSSSLTTDQSRENLINLYYLFQDNLNSTKPDLV